MNTRAPSSFSMQSAMTALMEARERLLAIDAAIDDDAQLLADMLEGEAGEAMTIIERIIEASIDADSMADAAKLRKTEIAERQARFEKRRDTLRGIALSALEALNMRKLERPAWTAFLRVVQPPLIVDEEMLPDQWFRTKREPLRAEIRKELAAGGDIAGAVLGNASTGISIRTR